MMDPQNKFHPLLDINGQTYDIREAANKGRDIRQGRFKVHIHHQK